jgi:molybdenum cofactor cytidylyltransferase
MGRIKQLLPLGNKPVISHCLDTLIASEINDIVVVFGPHRAEILRVIAPLPNLVKIAYNDIPGSEMAESVRIGLGVINTSSSGVLVCLSDHPMVSRETIKTLIGVHREDPDRIIIPLYRGTRGHPTLFPARVIREVLTGRTLREITSKHPEKARYLEVQDEGVILDLDTVEDYKKLSEKMVID